MNQSQAGTFFTSDQAGKVIGACVLVIHLILVGLPSVNLEFAFSAATQFFATGDEQLLAVYFRYQANTLGLPLLSYGLHLILPFVDIAQTPRLASTLGIPLFTLGILRLNRLLGAAKAPPSLLVGVSLLNPLVWVYSGRGTADFLPMAVGVFGLSLVWGESLTTRRMLTASIALGAAIVLKYHAGILLLFALADVFLRDDASMKRRVSRSLLLAGASALLPLVYLLAVRLRFHFWVTPPMYQAAFRIKPEDALTNFVVYLTYLMIMLLPLSLVALAALARPGKRAALMWSGAVGVTVLSGILVRPKGEMGFGPLDGMIAPWFLGMLSAVGALLFCSLMLRVIKEDVGHSPYPRFAAIGTMFYVAVLSLTRPAQRYLMLTLPIAYFMLLGLWSFRPVIVASIATLPLFALADGYIAGHQFVEGGAAQELTEQISASGLLPVTDPNVILGHTGLPFFPYADSEKRYRVVSGKLPNAILSSEKSLFGIMRGSFSVIPIAESSPK